MIGQNTAITARKPSRLEVWAREVKERDGCCKHCGRTDSLHAHHIQPKSTHPELKYEVSNGMTLCYRCHKAEHERNRVRVRSNKPQRRTLYKQIAVLEQEVRALKAQNADLRSLVGRCERGSCVHGLALSAKRSELFKFA